MKVTFESKGKVVDWNLPMAVQDEKVIMEWAAQHKNDVTLANLLLQFVLYCARSSRS